MQLCLQRHGCFQLQLCRVQQHLLHRQVVDERICHPGRASAHTEMPGPVTVSVIALCCKTERASAPNCSTYAQWRLMNIWVGGRLATRTRPLSWPSVLRPAKTSAETFYDQINIYDERCEDLHGIVTGQMVVGPHPAAKSCHYHWDPSAAGTSRVICAGERWHLHFASRSLRSAHQRGHFTCYDIHPLTLLSRCSFFPFLAPFLTMQLMSCTPAPSVRLPLVKLRPGLR